MIGNKCNDGVDDGDDDKGYDGDDSIADDVDEFWGMVTTINSIG